MGQVPKLPGPFAGDDIPSVHPFWSNEGGAVAGLETPGPGTHHLFVAFCPKIETQL